MLTQPSSSGSRKLILCVEDDAHLVQGIVDLLELSDYRVAIALDGVEGLEKTRVLKPDLILADIMMPHMDGIEMLKEIRREPRLADIPVVFLTAKGEKADVRRGMLLGVDDYIIKPYDPYDLLLRLELVFLKHSLKTPPKPRCPHDIFISYSRKDETIMRRICEALAAHQLTYWVDANDLKPGTRSWRKAVEQAIENAGCLVVLLSPDAKASKWIEAELDYADSHGKMVFPVLIRGNRATSAPLGVSTAQMVDLVSTDFDSGIHSLVEAVQHFLNSTSG